jgi:hypothetical protein
VCAAGNPGQIPDAGNDYAETTYRLLILCARQCGNQRLQRMLTALSLQTLRYSKLGLASVARRQRRPAVARGHRGLAQGDVERMVALTRQRIEESGEEAIRQLGLPQPRETSHEPPPLRHGRHRPAGRAEGHRNLHHHRRPACTRLLADFGADVIKIEPPEGDPVRQMGQHVGDVSLYAASILRNKRSIALDLKTPQGRELAAELIARADILVENNRPGVMERLGLGYEALSARNPGLVMVRISGYGQSGPYAERPGYGAICEAVGGVRHMTGDPDRPPARVALATTDYLSSVYAAFGAVTAIHARTKTGKGQVVDVALYEAAFTQMEPVVPAFEKLGQVPMREGANLPSMAPNSSVPHARRRLGADRGQQPAHLAPPGGR